MSRRLVILTTHFGTNFSGGSTATCEIFSRLENHFDEIVVFGTEIGEHPFKSILFEPFENQRKLKGLITKYDTKETAFYGDFYNAVAFVEVGVPFYFTYHDNWPELASTSFENWLAGFSYIRAYKKIFQSAEHVFTVSRFKQEQILEYTSNSTLARNGFQRATELATNINRRNILMVGNIDSRKYQKALALFKRWQPDCEVHIYGRVIDKSLAERLAEFPFVSIKGFINEVPYGDYRILLHTSLMENLPITFCEAIDAKTPIVTFDVGGSSEVVTADSGCLVPPYDLEEMKSSVTKALDSYNSFKFEHSTLANFSWDKAAEQYQKVLLAS